MHSSAQLRQQQQACFSGRTAQFTCSRSGAAAALRSGQCRRAANRRKISINALLKPVGQLFGCWHCHTPHTPEPSASSPAHTPLIAQQQAGDVPVSWSQTTDEVLIKVPVDASVRGKEVDFEVHPTRLRLAVRGNTLLEGSLLDAGAVSVDSEYYSSQGECTPSSWRFSLAQQQPASGLDNWSKAAGSVANTSALVLTRHRHTLSPTAPNPTPVTNTDSFWVLETDDDSGDKYVQITLAKATMGFESWPALLVADLPDTSITHRVGGLVTGWWRWGWCAGKGL